MGIRTLSITRTPCVVLELFLRITAHIPSDVLRHECTLLRVVHGFAIQHVSILVLTWVTLLTVSVSDDMADPHANAGEPTNMSGWTNCDVTVSTPEGAAAYADNSQFFLDIVESALSTGDPEPASYGLCTGET